METKEIIEDQSVYYDQEKVKGLQQQIAVLKKEILIVDNDDGKKKPSSSWFGKSSKKEEQEGKRDPRLEELERELKQEIFKPRRHKNDIYNAANPLTTEHYKDDNNNIKNTIQAHNVTSFGCGCCMALISALAGTGSPM